MSATTDYIPTSDTDYLAWLQNFVSYLSANLTALGLTAADQTAAQNALNDFSAKLTTHNTAQAAAQSGRQAKDDARDNSETVTRGMAAVIQATATVTDAQREALGLNVRATTRTAVGPPTTRPVAQVDTSHRLRHTISFGDESTPTSRGKPAGAQGCEIWMKVGDPAPAGPDEVKYLALDTRTPYTVEFDAADAGKKAYYMLRWINTRGETGPWSQTVSATITN